MKKIWFLPFLLFLTLTLSAQYEEWSDPVALTDSSSYNTDPVIVAFETGTCMFYEKKMTPGGQPMIWYRDIQNMGPETEFLSAEDHGFRNPVIAWHYDYEPYYWLFYESDQDGNFDIFAISFDEFMNFGFPIQLTFTPADENSMSLNSNYEFLSWERDGNIIAADYVMDMDTVYLESEYVIDSGNCSDPSCCNLRIVYNRWQADTAAVYASDYGYPNGWGEPFAIDSTGNNSHCHCSIEFWDAYVDESVVFEKEGEIMVNYYDQQYLFEPPDIFGEMHQPYSAFYTIPLDNVPAPLFITFATSGATENDIYVYWDEWGWGAIPTNLSGDTLLNSNPGLHWGWYASAPCSRYFMDIWETEKSGHPTLYMSKTPLYVCGGIDETGEDEEELEVYPNPFSEKLVIRYQASGFEPVRVELFNMEGIRVGQKTIVTIVNGWNEFILEPPVKLLPGPLYILLTQGDRQLFRKVIYK